MNDLENIRKIFEKAKSQVPKSTNDKLPILLDAISKSIDLAINVSFVKLPASITILLELNAEVYKSIPQEDIEKWVFWHSYVILVSKYYLFHFHGTKLE